MKKTSFRATAKWCAIPLALVSFSAAKSQETAPTGAASTRTAAYKREFDAALLAAIRANDLRDVTNALQQGADPNARAADAFRAPALSLPDKNTDIAIVRALLDAGANLEATDAPGNAPLAFAAIHNRPDVIALLLKRGARLESNGFKGMTPLMIAASSGSAAALRALLDAGANVNARSDSNGTALFYGAAIVGNIGIVKALVAAGADVGAAADNGKRAVDVAADSGNFDINDYLVSIYNRDNALLGAASQAAGLTGGAAESGWNDAKKALDSGASGRFANAAGTTALMLLALNAKDFDEATARRVIAVSNINAQEQGGNSVLHLAADRRNAKMAALLVASKASLNLKNKDGQTPLDIALAQQNNEEVVALLRAAGAQTATASTPLAAPIVTPMPIIQAPPIASPTATSPTTPLQNAPTATAPTATAPTATNQTAPAANAPTSLEVLNQYGRSPLMQAARDGNAAEIARLLQRGARPNFANTDGQTALFFAAIGNSATAIKALAQAGADLNYRDKKGEVALVAAAFHGDAQTLRALVEAGADLRFLDDAIAKARSGVRGAVDSAQRATSTATYGYLVSLKK